jgi:hypothetical protein
MSLYVYDPRPKCGDRFLFGITCDRRQGHWKPHHGIRFGVEATWGAGDGKEREPGEAMPKLTKSSRRWAAVYVLAWIAMIICAIGLFGTVAAWLYAGATGP